MSRDILELGASLGFLDELYERQQAEPGAIDPELEQPDRCRSARPW